MKQRFFLSLALLLSASMVCHGNTLKTIEFLNLEQSQKRNQPIYSQYLISSVKDLDVIEGILNRILEKETTDFLVSKFPFKKDFFKSSKIALKLIADIKANPQSAKSLHSLQSLPEYGVLTDVLNALRNNGLSPIEEVVELLWILPTIAKHVSQPQITIEPSKNIALPQVQPAKEEEFTRPHLLSQNAAPCTYSGPKKGYGYKAGLKVNCQGETLKLKFGVETHSGPFNSRIIRALGYESPQIDYVQQLEMAYDRRFITEFNSRQTTTTYFNLAGRTIKKTVGNAGKKNAMNHVISIKLKDGTQLTGENLSTFSRSFYSFETGQFNDELESQISTVTFSEGSVSKDVEGIEVGPWRFEEPRHLSNPQLRQALILFAWFGNTDFPMNNNALLLKKDENNKYFTTPIYDDVGFGLGISGNLSNMSSSDIERMPDIMSSPVQNDQDDSVSNFTKKVALLLIPKTPNDMLSDLRYKDVINGAALLCQLNEQQIFSALKSAGYDDNTSQRGTKKLIHRRTQLLRDFELTEKFASCMVD